MAQLAQKPKTEQQVASVIETDHNAVIDIYYIKHEMAEVFLKYFKANMNRVGHSGYTLQQMNDEGAAAKGNLWNKALEFYQNKKINSIPNILEIIYFIQTVN